MDKIELNQTILGIRKLAKSIEQSEFEIKTIKEQLSSILENLPEYQEVKDAAEELKAAKDKLAAVLMRKPQYNNLAEELAEKKHELAEDREVLSSHLVAYYAQTAEYQVLLDEGSNQAREVIVTGKLGKEDKKFQTSLFSKEQKS